MLRNIHRMNRRAVLEAFAGTAALRCVASAALPMASAVLPITMEKSALAQPLADESVASTAAVSKIPVLPLFSTVEPALGDSYGRSPVISEIAIVPGLPQKENVQFFAVGDDHRVRVWNLSLTTPIDEIPVEKEVAYVPGKTPADARHQPLWYQKQGPTGHLDWIYALAIAPNGQKALTGDASGRLLQWTLDANGMPDDAPQVLINSGTSILSAAFRPDLSEAVIVGDRGLLQRVTSEGKVQSMQTKVSGTSHSVVYSPDGKYFASVGDSGMVRVHNSDSGAIVVQKNSGGRRIRRAAYSPDGTRLAVAGDSGVVMLWTFDPATGVLGQAMEFSRQTGKIYSLVWCDNDGLVTGASDGQIRIYDTKTQQIVMMSDKKGHVGTVATMSWLPESRMLLSAGYDTMIRLWKLT